MIIFVFKTSEMYLKVSTCWTRYLKKHASRPTGKTALGVLCMCLYFLQKHPSILLGALRQDAEEISDCQSTSEEPAHSMSHRQAGPLSPNR